MRKILALLLQGFVATSYGAVEVDWSATAGFYFNANPSVGILGGGGGNSTIAQLMYSPDAIKDDILTNRSGAVNDVVLDTITISNDFACFAKHCTAPFTPGFVYVLIFQDNNVQVDDWYYSTPMSALINVTGIDFFQIIEMNTNFVQGDVIDPDFNTARVAALLTVNNGTGGGAYAIEDQVAITANAAGGKTFVSWIGDTQYVASATSATTTVIIPARDVTLTATYADAIIAVTNFGCTYTQDFNSLPTSGTNLPWTQGATILGWYRNYDGTIAEPGRDNTLTTLTTNSTSGVVGQYGFINVGITNSIDRAVVLRGSSNNPNNCVGAVFKNTAGSTATNVLVGYTGETWRQFSNITATINFEYAVADSLNTTTLDIQSNNLTWTAFNALNYTTKTGGTSGINGSLATNQTVFRPASIGAAVTNNQYLILRWRVYDPADCPAAGIDDVSVTMFPLFAFALTVSGGTGSGAYTNQQVITIEAGAPATGKTFDRWTGATQYVASVTSASTTVTMPARDITLNATYRDVYYALTVNGGTGSGSYTNQQQVQISADAPTSGNTFDRWTGDTGYVADYLSSITTVTMPAGNIALTATYTVPTSGYYNEWQFTIKSNGCATITGVDGVGQQMGYIYVPLGVYATFGAGYYPVDSIENLSLWAGSLTNVIIGTNVIQISDAAFNDGENLAAITVDSNNFVYSSVNGVLFDKNQAALIRYPQGKSESSYTIASNVTNIGNDAFRSCTNLFNVTIPNSVTYIGSSAFRYDNNLTNALIGSGVASIRDYAFASCTRLMGAYFQGNAPKVSSNISVFSGATNAIVYRLSGAAGWPTVPNTWVGCPTALWDSVPTKIIGLSGNLSFGGVVTEQTSSATLTINNSGNTTLTVTSISYPACFSGAWSGTLGAGASTNVTVTFAPLSVTNYSGTVTVNSDATGGTNTISATGAGITAVVALDGSLDGTGFLWITGGTAPWVAETAITHDGADAAKSGIIGDQQTSWLKTTVSGSGTLSFWWKVSSEPDYDFLWFRFDGATWRAISGEADWQLVAIRIEGAGLHTLEWVYTKDKNTSNGLDAGWVDQVSFVPDMPADADADGIPDSWELQYFGNTTNANPNAICSNGINTVRQAYIAGLDPTNSQSMLRATALATGKTLGWNAASGRVYSVYFSTNLMSGFQCVGSNIPWTQTSFTNSTAVPCGYYKIGVQLE